MYQPRHYRGWVAGQDLVAFRVVVRETDLYLRATTDLTGPARRLVRRYRQPLEGYIRQHPDFLTSLVPLQVAAGAPPIVRRMAEAAARAGVGPMAAVAGAIAECVGEGLAALSPEIIIENGGDIYLKSHQPRVVGVFAGDSPLSGRIGLEIKAEETPLGICTSSGTVGHSLSFGQADAVIALAPSAALADAAATAVGNVITLPDDIPTGIELAQHIRDISGLVIIKGEHLGLWGRVKICQMAPS
ncbi:MAG: UPF0280 family protein [Chloroflexota bacterium]